MGANIRPRPDVGSYRSTHWNNRRSQAVLVCGCLSSNHAVDLTSLLMKANDDFVHAPTAVTA